MLGSRERDVLGPVPVTVRLDVKSRKRHLADAVPLDEHVAAGDHGEAIRPLREHDMS